MIFKISILESLADSYQDILFVYAVLIFATYIYLAYLSFGQLKKYLKKNSFVNYDVLLSSEFAPQLSLIAPAYNEAVTIEENVKSLLSLNYNNYEVIVVNDGSKDNSMEVLIGKYDLVPFDLAYETKIPTKNVKAIYKSRNNAFKKLLVVDKENGGKADALNVGMNVSSFPYTVCIDVDCVLDKDALLKLAKPFLELTDKRVIATGGVVRIANQCVIEDGRLKDISIPDKMLPRIQVLEYLRAFLLGRMAWERLDGLLLISGAFGAFDKEIVLLAGGYNTKTVGEDMELVVRMRRYMFEHNLPYTVSFIPDPLCWTEAPETFGVFKRQRSRWMRGTIETLWIHRKMFLNPKYKLMGMLSMPYWFLFEFLAPFIEFSGIMVTIIFAFMGMISWKFALLMLLIVYCFAVMLSIFALYTEERTYHKYSKINDFLKLFVGVLVEPFYFHLIVVYAALVGYVEKIKGSHRWGEMTRTGFQKK
ncbi:glycosyltransferase [Flavobacterium granuli]|uniref:Cellulose synthase/poly-beta-1,6-N-acetylglucosamine synthase-like glycosyltransferase n=1 Tax=Flavobacterium granuli TaxID=280093 RepID=A0ABU1S4I6_9FLAO|nr:glycosyltransferase [Flavobacterium granuli]MDR6845946.1 cellulose synthase/poly-beta-1,6-N-acetylglucosamine synthase-like glycosyltransferase [Flavobacterium granuli]